MSIRWEGIKIIILIDLSDVNLKFTIYLTFNLKALFSKFIGKIKYIKFITKNTLFSL